jgi:hypothetical protein
VVTSSTQPDDRVAAPVGLRSLIFMGCAAAILLGCSDTGGSTSTDSIESMTESRTVSDTLPDLRFERPDIASASWTETETYLTVDETGAVETVSQESSFTADYASSTVRVEIRDSTKPGVVTVIYTPSHVYARTTADEKPWTRFSRTRIKPGAMERPDYLGTYQDMITSSMRADATEVVTSTAEVDGVILTTYAFTVGTLELPERGQEMLRAETSIDVIVSSMELTIDETGIVRRWRMDLDEGLARLMMRSRDEDSIRLSSSAEIISLNEPVTVSLPTVFVDEE